MKTEHEIEQMHETAEDAARSPRCHAMTYEEGVEAALYWVLHGEEPPIDK